MAMRISSQRYRNTERQKQINTEIKTHKKTERQKTEIRQMQNSKIDRHKKTN